MDLAPQPIRLAEAGDRTDDGLVYIELARVGRHRSRDGGSEVEITAEMLRSMVENHARVLAEGWSGRDASGPRGVPIKLDPEHAAAEGKTSDPKRKLARGYIQRVEMSADGSTLLGAVRWTDEGRQLAQGFSLSIEARTGLGSKITDEEWPGYTLTGAVLTDSPMIPGLAIAASERPPTPEPRMPELMLSEDTRAALSLGAQPTADEVRAAVLRLSDERDALKTERDATKLALAEVEKQRDAHAAKLEELRLAEEQRTITAAIEAGRITKAESDDWRKVVGAGGLALAERVYPEGRCKVQLSEQGGTGTDGAAVEVTAESVAAEITAKSEELRKGGMDWSTAARESRRLVLADPHKAEIFTAIPAEG